MGNTVESILLFAAGSFSLIASILNWNWFFEHRKAQLFVKLLGRTGARAFYTLLGLVMLAIGFKIMFFA